MTESIEAPVIDFGSHFLADEVVRVDDLDTERGDEVSSDPERYLQWFKAGGIDRVVLSNPNYMGHGSVDETAEANDTLLSVIDSSDDYYGLASIPVSAGGEQAAAEFERCLDSGFNGGGVSTTANGQDLTDPAFEAVLEVADRTGAPIMVHPTPAVKLRPEEHVLDPVNQINHSFGREARLCGSISKVIHAGLLERYPNLKLVYHHFGGNIASMMGRVDLRLHRNTDDTRPFEEFKDRLEQRIYIDTSGYHAYSTPLRAALEQFPTSSILLGTDAPAEPKTRSDLTEYVTTITDAVPRSQARKLLGQNALDVMVNV